MNRVSVLWRLAGPALAAVLAAVPALGTVRETRTYNGVASNGVLNSPANVVQTTTLTGGYSLGRVDLSGTLTSQNANTFGSDAQILISAPNGASYTFHPFDGSGPFSTLNFSRSIFIPGVNDPAGGWAFRFYEVVDNGGTAQVDASWNINLNFTDEPPTPPAAVDLGNLTQPGAAAGPFLIPTTGYTWYTFAFSREVLPGLGRFVDISVSSTDNSADTEIALFDSAGSLVASDDDSGPALLSQLSFGAGTRPPIGDGAPFDGRDGTLAAGTYYLAIGRYDLQFPGAPWGLIFRGAAGTLNASFQITTNLQPGTDCFVPTVTQQPQSVLSSLGQTVQFTTDSTGTGIPTYRWRHNNVDLADDAVISGSGTPMLIFTGVRSSDGGSYTAFVSNACGDTTSTAAALGVTCSADFDGNGDVGTDADIEAFFACLSGFCCDTCGSVDFNGDGDLGTDADIESFFRVLAGGTC